MTWSTGAKEVEFGRGGTYQLKIITSSNNPILACNESCSTDRHIGNVECSQEDLRIVVVYMYLAVVKGTQNPIFSGMKIDSLDAIGSTGQELLNLCSLHLHPGTDQKNMKKQGAKVP
jgi:hypothetical protein